MRPASGTSPGVAEPARAWTPQPVEEGAGTPIVDAAGAAPPAGGGLQGGARPASTVAREAEAARREFHRAAGGQGGGSGRPPARAAALQAFFVANAGRGLMPAGETSGVLSPNLKSEEN
ncbi:MAG: hypothetical protein KKA37_07340 [Alphaproteobacteria bacterium]|nr:hypothetical protein [Alphaproteobacteria bacterium]